MRSREQVLQTYAAGLAENTEVVDVQLGFDIYECPWAEFFLDQPRRDELFLSAV